jgi:hypothetical protein
LNVALKKRLIEKVPLFKACSPAGVIALVQNLQPHIILPNDLIIRQGEKVRVLLKISILYYTRASVVHIYLCVTKMQQQSNTTGLELAAPSHHTTGGKGN